ncbi:MAG: hypothetical protein Q4C60_09000 [Eubacteriales bacterium]|nr:hypothetical protein [Eubacteriales bacterium]
MNDAMMLQELQKITQKLEQIDVKTDRIEERTGRIEEKADKTAADVRKICLEIENEIRPNIMRVAEGHLDLVRHLEEAQHPVREIEVLSVKMRYLESEMRLLKSRI